MGVRVDNDGLNARGLLLEEPDDEFLGGAGRSDPGR